VGVQIRGEAPLLQMDRVAAQRIHSTSPVRQCSAPCSPDEIRGASSTVISAMPGPSFAATGQGECPATGHGRAKPQAGTVPWSIGRCAAYPGISADIVRRVGRAAVRFSPPRSAAVGGLKPTLPLARLELRVLQALRAPSADTAAAARCFPAALRLAPERRAGCESPSTAPRLAIAGQLRCTARR
jgi:hypothetical protein